MTETTLKKEKRVRFGAVTVVHIPAPCDSQRSSLVSSQAVSSELRASVQHAFSVLGARDCNALPAPSFRFAKGCHGTSLVLGDGDDVMGGVHGQPTPPKSPQGSQQMENDLCIFDAQRPRLYVDPFLATLAATQGQANAQLPNPITVEGDAENEDSHTLDDEAEEEPHIAPRDETTHSKCVDARSAELAKKEQTLPSAIPSVISPPRVTETSPTFSQLVSALDDILGNSQLHHELDDVPVLSAPPAEAPALAPHNTLDSYDNPQHQDSDDAHQTLPEPQQTKKAISAAHYMNDGHEAHEKSCVTNDAAVNFTVAQHTTRCSESPVNESPSTCVFCALSAVAQRHPQHSPPLLMSDGHSYHLVCALWCPEVYVEETTHMLRGVGGAVRRARDIKCALCRQPGAAVGCAVLTCQLSFHLPCAVKARASMRSECFVLYCPRHRGTPKEDSSEAEGKADKEDSLALCKKRARLR
jgi:hypothetical protein